MGTEIAQIVTLWGPDEVTGFHSLVVYGLLEVDVTITKNTQKLCFSFRLIGEGTSTL